MNYFADNQDRIGPNAGPGHWNDPDMVGASMKFPKLVQSPRLENINKNSIDFLVDYRKLRSQLRAIQSSNGDLGYFSSTFNHVPRLTKRAVRLP